MHGNQQGRFFNGYYDCYFGEAGCHVRSAIGHATLPNQISVEIEAIVAVSVSAARQRGLQRAGYQPGGRETVICGCTSSSVGIHSSLRSRVFGCS